jgi:hypothetical protein
MRRIHHLITSVPLPASGTQSTTIMALSAYAQDMRYMMPRIDKLFVEAFACECRDAPDWAQEELENNITECEQWVEQRKCENWRLR